MRVVLDVNVLMSAIISSKGSPDRIMELWEEERFKVVISPEIIGELGKVIHYPKIQEKYHLPGQYVAQFLELISNQAIVIKPVREITQIKSDPEDDKYLECAVAGGAAYIISGDQHLLRLVEYQGMPILSPAEFLVVLKLDE
ncbi:MAG: putative toxin-antitoxin system toxin component, PIN family [Anaerolineales bacterium]